MPLLETRASGSSSSYGLNSFRRSSFTTSGLLVNYDFSSGTTYGGENLLRSSTNISNTSYWNLANVSVSSQPSITDPFGGSNTYKVVGTNGVTTRQGIFQQFTVTSGVKYTISIYLKAAERRYATIWLDGINIAEGAYQGSGFTLDLLTGTFPIAPPTNNDISAVSVGNGWYLLSVSGTISSGTNVTFYLTSGTPNNDIAGYISNGDGTSGIYASSPQARSNTTTAGYVPTTTSTVSRATGNIIYDTTANGYNTTLGNWSYSTSTANRGGSAVFVGASNSGGTLPGMGSYQASTITFWARREAGSAGGADMLIAGSPGYQFGDASWSGSYGEWYYPNQVSIPLSTWGHWAIVINSNYTYSIYRNGFLEGTYGPGGGTGLTSYSGLILANGYGGRYFAGALGKFSVYNRALTQSEVVGNFEAERSRFQI